MNTFRIRLAMLLLILLASVVACEATTWMTPEDAAEYEDLRDSVKQRGKIIDEQAAAAVGLRSEIDSLMAAAESQTWTVSAIEALNDANAALVDTVAAMGVYGETQDIEEARMDELEDTAMKPGGALMDLVGAIFPPAKGASDLWLLLGGLLVPRMRENASKGLAKTSKAIGQAFKAEPVEAVKTLVSAGRSFAGVIGAAHTTSDPNKLLAASQAKADAAGLELTKDGNGAWVYAPKAAS